VNAELATLSDTDAVAGGDTITVSAVDQFGNAATASIDVAVNAATTSEPPVLSNAGNSASYSQFGTAVTVDGTLTVSDPENATLTSATVAITSGFAAGDVLSYVSQNGIAGSYDTATGSLVLSGAASLAAYQAALDSITFSSATLTPSFGARTVTWTVNDGTLGSAVVTSAVGVTLLNGNTITLTPAADVATGTPANDLFIAASGALSAGDKINGNGGADYLGLLGGGTFDLRAPATLNGIFTVEAFEGTDVNVQTIYLRKGSTLTVDAVSDPNGAEVSAGAGIVIVGTADSATINLGDGTDTVVVGSSLETVNGGAGNDTFDVTAKTIGAHIAAGGNDTLVVSGGGTGSMANVSGVTNATLLATTTLLANAGAGLTIAGKAAKNKVTLGAADQTFIGTAGGDTVTLSASGGDTVRGTSAGLAADKIANFAAAAGNVVDITDLDPALAAITSAKVSSSATVLGLSDGTHSTTIELLEPIYPGSFVLAADGSGGTDLAFVPDAAQSSFTLSPLATTILAGPVNTVISTTAADLLAEDSLTGGKLLGSVISNTLALVGGGTFNLAAPLKLSTFQVVTAAETVGGTTVDLRRGLNVALNVADGGPGASITVVGNADTSVINLGNGNDTVTLGSATELVNGGSGSNTFNVTAATIKATINGGSSGGNALVVSGGGKAVMDSSITGISTVQVVGTTLPTTLVLNGLSGLTAMGSSGADTIMAGGASQTITGNGGADILIGSAAGIDTFLDTSANLNGATINNLLASDAIDVTDLSFASAVVHATAGTKTTALNFTDGAHIGTITLGGSLTAGFTLSSDGHTGTLIRYV
jgi:hypothetical protein